MYFARLRHLHKRTRDRTAWNSPTTIPAAEPRSGAIPVHLAGVACRPALERPEARPACPRKKKPRPGRPGVARALAEHPKIFEAMVDACPHCEHALSPADQSEIHAYDHIDLCLFIAKLTTWFNAASTADPFRLRGQESGSKP
jgi:hypothetical protein